VFSYNFDVIIKVYYTCSRSGAQPQIGHLEPCQFVCMKMLDKVNYNFNVSISHVLLGAQPENGLLEQCQCVFANALKL